MISYNRRGAEMRSSDPSSDRDGQSKIEIQSIICMPDGKEKSKKLLVKNFVLFPSQKCKLFQIPYVSTSLPMELFRVV